MPKAERTHTIGIPKRSRGNWELDKDYFTEAHARIAHGELRRAQREDNFPTNESDYVTRTDAKIGHEREHQVRFGGKIQYIRFGMETDWIPAAIDMIKFIMRRIPYAAKRPWDIRSGIPFRRRHYRDSFVLMRNNAMVIGPGPLFESRAINYIEKYAASMKAGDLLQVTNIQPYARRIEEGAPGKKPWSSQAPRGVLKRTESAGRRNKKTKALFIRYEQRPLPGEVTEHEFKTQGHVTYADRRRKRGGWKYTGKIYEKHRAYPVLAFGPPIQNETRLLVKRASWTHRPSHSRYIESRGGVGATIAEQLARQGAALL